MLSVSCGTRFAGLNRFGNEPHPVHMDPFRYGAFRSTGVCMAGPRTISKNWSADKLMSVKSLTVCSSSRKSVTYHNTKRAGLLLSPDGVSLSVGHGGVSLPVFTDVCKLLIQVSRVSPKNQP